MGHNLFTIKNIIIYDFFSNKENFEKYDFRKNEMSHPQQKRLKSYCKLVNFYF